MSEDQSPKTKGSRVAPMVAVAAGAALTAGLLFGIYAFSGSVGNLDDTSTVSAQCPVDETMRAKLYAAAQGQVAAFVPLDRGLSVSELSFNNAQGERIALADWSGRTVLLNLWATWCAPCRAEMPALEALNEEEGGDDFEVVPVSLDLGEADKPKAFYQEIELDGLRFFHDPEMGLLNALKPEGVAFGLPATLLIDERGCVLGSLSGPAAWESEDAKALIRAAL
ncbi:MAG: TlpA disulfide reductase family protein [Ahrensia sp.]|nr:TlpA disulfide reductase family protein [Ahrensia sp.]